jgi:hypothetical protein
MIYRTLEQESTMIYKTLEQESTMIYKTLEQESTMIYQIFISRLHGYIIIFSYYRKVGDPMVIYDKEELPAQIS